jgi:hypothetical protein
MSDRTTDTSDTLHEQPERDHFKHESPIRAFTTWSVEGLYAIGKGFRPSLQHLVPYLNAMESKEGWRLLQVLEAATGSPSFVFRADTPPMYTVNVEAPFVAVEAVLRKVAIGLRQVAHDMMQDDMDALTNGGFADRVRGYAAELAPEVTDRDCGFVEAGNKIDAAVAMGHKLDKEDGGYPAPEVTSEPTSLMRERARTHRVLGKVPELAVTFTGLDAETTFHTRARWTAHIGVLHSAARSMHREWLQDFFKKESVTSMSQYWQTASVASVLRLIDRLGWWDRIALADPITEKELGKVLGRKFRSDDPALQACTTDIYKAVGNDPINPKHYGGRACADIGERLSANGYQVLKYCWRLGKKDDPCQELDKALWYLDSEVALLVSQDLSHILCEPDTCGIPCGLSGVAAFCDDRITDQSEFVRYVACALWNGYNVAILNGLRARIVEEKIRLECGSGLAI